FVSWSHSPDLRELPSFPTRRSSDLSAAAGDDALGGGAAAGGAGGERAGAVREGRAGAHVPRRAGGAAHRGAVDRRAADHLGAPTDRKSTRLNSSHVSISYAVFCLKK